MQETVNDVMSKKVVAVLPGDTLEEAARLMKEHDVGVLPVVSGGELKGLVTDRDIVLQCVAAGKEPSQVKAYQIMTKDVVSVSPGQPSARRPGSWERSRSGGCRCLRTE